ncbi:hypothetical protein HKX48_007334 [Thoreauomyces humboldtii]|nr:hypothetical protein HKX48_007334 [Thoreauomyces humboldtii]
MSSAAYGPRIAALLSQYSHQSPNITNGISHSTDVAVDLEDSIAILRSRSSSSSSSQPQPDDPDLTLALEESIKSYVDMLQHVTIQQRILKDMATDVAAGRKVGEDEEGGGVSEGLADAFKNKFRAAVQEWAGKEDRQKYHGAEPYIAFKEKVWNARHPDMPFSIRAALAADEGEPAHQDEGGQGNDDDDMELEIVSQHMSLQCPITTQTLEDPVTSQTCKHSYSRGAITEHIRHGEKHNPSRRAECPVAGCARYITLADLKPDKDLARLVRRKLAEEDEEAGREDEEYAVMD